MSIIAMTIATAPAVAPAGQVFAQYKYSILAADGVTVVQSMESTADTVTFATDVPEGSYTASVIALDATGANLGTPATAAFTVAAGAGSSFDQPQTVTVTQS